MKKPGRSDQADSFKTKKSHEINHEIRIAHRPRIGPRHRDRKPGVPQR